MAYYTSLPASRTGSTRAVQHLRSEISENGIKSHRSGLESLDFGDKKPTFICEDQQATGMLSPAQGNKRNADAVLFSAVWYN